MAERRMFAKTIIASDAFLDMPLSARCLYFALGMYADDEGFVNSPKSLARLIGASTDDMNILLVRRFIIAFPSGVCLIKHWRINNYLRSDRFQPTKYTEERNQVMIEENGAYVLIAERYTNGIPNDGIPRLGENREDKVSLEKERIEEIAPPSVAVSNSRFAKPTIDEITAYCSERKNNVDPQAFFDFYESKGWRVGNQPMKDWKASVRTWERRQKPSGGQPNKPSGDKYKRED
ncbi:MAG: hypothetical protein NC184_05555 [Roseburia sp.]|nr:hypothetical protein [Roseburia sp.]